MTPKLLRDNLLTYLAEHDAACPKGNNCRERFNIVGFLAHCAGIRVTPNNMAELRQAVELYEFNCRLCSHLRD